MRAEHHYDDESLIALLESGDDFSRDPHLTSCASCSEVATTLRQIAGALKEEDVWDPRELDETPCTETMSALRGYADEMSREDTFAAAHLQTLLAGPRDAWMSNLHAHPEYRTAGMVRSLIAATDHAIDTMPPDAVAIISLATEIADHLPASAYSTDTVAKLRGAAWRERAFALFYVGSYTEAEEAICASERHFSDCAVNEWDLGRADIVHALVNRGLDRDADAIVVARTAADRLRDFGDTQRYVSAVTIQAQMRMKAFDYAGALNLMLPVEQELSDRLSADAHARLLSNIAICQRGVGDVDGAIQSSRSAIFLFETLNVPTEVVRARANVTTLLREAGRIAEAVEELHAVRAGFERLAMAFDAAIVDLVLAEIYLSEGKYDEVESLCHQLIEYFKNAGVPSGPRAMTALAFAAEAAQQRSLTPELVHHVQRYIRSLPSQPMLLFAPPPE